MYNEHTILMHQPSCWSKNSSFIRYIFVRKNSENIQIDLPQKGTSALLPFALIILCFFFNENNSVSPHNPFLLHPSTYRFPQLKHHDSNMILWRDGLRAHSLIHYLYLMSVFYCNRHCSRCWKHYREQKSLSHRSYILSGCLLAILKFLCLPSSLRLCHWARLTDSACTASLLPLRSALVACGYRFLTAFFKN